MSNRWMKGARTHPTKSGSIRLARRTEGINFEDRHCEIFAGMKGWRPPAILKARAGSGFQADVFMPGIGSIGLSFSMSSVPGFTTRGPWASKVPSCSPQARGRQVGANSVQTFAIETAPALHLLHETGGTEMKTEGTRNNPGRISNAHGAVPPLGPEAAERAKKAVGVGVSP
jgi:hypothetical protein